MRLARRPTVDLQARPGRRGWARAAGGVNAIRTDPNRVDDLQRAYRHRSQRSLARRARLSQRRRRQPNGFALITSPDLEAVAALTLEKGLDHTAYVSAVGPITPTICFSGMPPRLRGAGHSWPKVLAREYLRELGRSCSSTIWTRRAARGIELSTRIGENQGRRSVVFVGDCDSSAANRLSGMSFISTDGGNEDGTEAHIGAKNARIETGHIFGLQCRSSP
jgi:hypothetical protein